MPSTYVNKAGVRKKYNYYIRKTTKLPTLICDLTHKIRSISDRELLLNIDSYVDTMILAYETPADETPVGIEGIELNVASDH